MTAVTGAVLMTGWSVLSFLKNTEAFSQQRGHQQGIDCPWA